MFSLAYGSNVTRQLLQTTHEEIDRPLTPLFRNSDGSASLLKSYENLSFDGHPPIRKTWNFDRAQETLPAGFKLKTVPNRDWKLAKRDTKMLARGQDPFAPEQPPDPFMAFETDRRRSSVNDESSPASEALRQSFSSTTEPKMRRVDKYYKALMKEQREREEGKRREEHEEFLAKAEKAAHKARKEEERLARLARKEEESLKSSSSSEHLSDEEEEESDHEDPGPLKAYPGVMKVEVEVTVLRAPGVEANSSQDSEERASTATPLSTARSEETQGEEIDWNAELQALQEEFAEPVKEAESDDDSLPDGLDGRTLGNIDDNDKKRVALGLGGTAFFVPDVERYALAPSLLPPPPRAEGRIWKTGKKRLRLKPRLPLEVSKHRWRDERPYGCPVEDEYTPDLDRCRSWEEKVRLVELYGSLSSIISRMPKPDGVRKMPKDDQFDVMLDKELRNSLAWKQYIKRQRLLEMARFERKNKDGAATDVLLEGFAADGAGTGPPKDIREKKPPSADKTSKARMQPGSQGSGDPRLRSVTAGVQKASA
jgi:hypothetical protein